MTSRIPGPPAAPADPPPAMPDAPTAVARGLAVAPATPSPVPAAAPAAVGTGAAVAASGAPASAGLGAGPVFGEEDAETLRERLWSAVQARGEHAAVAVCFEALDGGMTAEDVLLDVIGPVQARVGQEWAAGRISVAQEHAATAIHDRVIAAVAHRTPHAPSRTPRNSSGTAPTRVTVACVEGEWHALPARILAEVLRGRGFTVDFLGAQVPTPHLIAHLHQTGPDVVALSSSIPTRLPAAHAAITAVQAIGLPVLAGGAAFGPQGRYARLLGADGWAPDARAAAEILAARLERPAPALPAGVPDAAGRLPHLEDQEYTLVVRSRPQLVKNVLTALEDRLPEMRSYTDQQRDRTTEDIAHIVDFLAASLYTDDPDLFAGFVTWTAGILQARHVPATVLTPALDLLAAELGDFPRALTHLGAAHAALTAFPSRTTAPVPGPGNHA
ncbi:cobalamin-dependent protein [Streptomyces sp. NPDC008121]|uniref:cobalamin B12-binding domain-containing protein n=1 Tax=Streptomyces sp. NPDC008121 TaxID=3364809 RepID=UPI0036E1D699